MGYALLTEEIGFFSSVMTVFRFSGPMGGPCGRFFVFPEAAIRTLTGLRKPKPAGPSHDGDFEPCPIPTNKTLDGS